MSHVSRSLTAALPEGIRRVYIACVAVLLIASPVIAQEETPIWEQVLRLDGLTDGKYMEYFKAMSESSPDRFEKQAVLFQAVTGKNANEAREAYIELVIQSFDPDAGDPVGIFAKTAPKGVRLEALVREGGPDGRLEGVLLGNGLAKTKPYRLLENIEYPIVAWASWESRQKADFSLYHEFLESHMAEYSAPLIEYMLLRDPGQALNILLEVYPDEFHDALAVRRARNVVDEWLWLERARGIVQEPDQATIDALESLGGGPDWWTRLYVLSWVQQRHDDRPYSWLEAWFNGRSNLILSLYDDEHPVVRMATRQYAEKAQLMDRIEQ